MSVFSPPPSRIPFSNLSSWNNHTFNELKQCNYEIGTAILPLRYYNMKSPIKNVMFSLAHSHTLDIFHLLSINPPRRGKRAIRLTG